MTKNSRSAAAVIQGGLCELYPDAEGLSAPLLAGIVCLALVGLFLLIGMRLVRWNVPLMRMRAQDCWMAVLRRVRRWGCCCRDGRREAAGGEGEGDGDNEGDAADRERLQPPLWQETVA